MLDDLADLFLTGTTGPAPAVPPKVMKPVRDPLTGPAPFKLAPKPVARHTSLPRSEPTRVGPSTPAPHTPSHIEEDRTDTPRLAGAAQTSTTAPPLRYTGDPYETEDLDELDPRTERDSLLPTPPQSIQPPMVEAVLLGNLPGLAGAWLTQYAQLLAQQDGPVAVLYLDPAGDGGEGRIDVELVEPSIHSAANSSPVRLPPPGPTRLRETINALCRSTEHPVRTVLVHADPQPAVLEMLAYVPSWTLLTGADPMAVRAAEMTLTTLIDNAGPVPPALGVVVMGSEQAQAQAVIDSLQDALPEPVSLLGYLKKLMPVAVRSVGEFAGLEAQWAHLSQWLAEHSVVAEAIEAPQVVEPAPRAMPEPVITQKQPSAATPPRVRPSPRLNPAMPRPASPQQAEAQSVSKSVEIEPARSEPLHVEPAHPVSMPSQAQRPKLSLASDQPPDLLSLLSSTPAAIEKPSALQARCPAQPETQLVLDGSGRLHLLGVHRHHEDREQSRSAQEALHRLTDAAQWAREHRDLLALTLHDQPFDRSTPPVLHLFTDRADLAVPLLAKPGPALNLHLLQQVTVHEHTTWLCTPLNRAG